MSLSFQFHILIIVSACCIHCGGSTAVDDAMVPPVKDAITAADANNTDDHLQVFSSFGIITTIAGTGQEETKGVNSWQPTFEGQPAANAELSRPHISQADSAGTIFIADKDAHGIRVVSTSGTIQTFAGTSIAGDDGDGPGLATSMSLHSPNGLWVARTGVVYILDLGNDKVRKVENGTMSTLFSIGGAATGRGLWVADDESLAYVSAGSVLKKWTPMNGVENFTSGFSSLGNIFVQADGSILVSDRGSHRVFRVTSEGQKMVVAGNGKRSGGGDGQAATKTGLDEVRGVWGLGQESNGRGFFVATHKGGQVWYVSPDGSIHLFVDGGASDEHQGDGLIFSDPAVQISEPRAITIDSQGNLLITEHDGGYIRRVLRK